MNLLKFYLFFILLISSHTILASPIDTLLIQITQIQVNRCESALKERRHPEATPLRTQALRETERGDFIQEYLQKSFITTAENEKWIEIANQITNEEDYFFLDIENSKLKYLNDHLVDKDLVTAACNLHKELVMDGLKKLFKANRLVFYPYSDFKSVRIALKRPFNKKFINRLDQTLQTINNQYTLTLVAKGVVRHSDAPQNWFRFGFGKTADQANMAARYSRNRIANELVDFDHPEVQENLKQTLNLTRTLLKKLNAINALHPFMIQRGDQKILMRVLFEITRKNPAISGLQSTLSKRLSVYLNPEQTELLKQYVEQVDRFSASLYVAKREIATATEATYGAISLDFTGLGSFNLFETAIGLTIANSVHDAVLEARLAEQRITTKFHQSIHEKRKVIFDYLRTKKGQTDLQSLCSGDDCIFILAGLLSEKEQRELIVKLSKTEVPSAIRVAFIGHQIEVPDMRNQLAAHGETIEKFTRDELYGKLPYEKMNHILLGVIMKGHRIGHGQVKLAIGNSRVQLTPLDLSIIQEAFENAVEKLNKELVIRSETDAKYQAATDLF